LQKNTDYLNGGVSWSRFKIDSSNSYSSSSILSSSMHALGEKGRNKEETLFMWDSDVVNRLNFFGFLLCLVFHFLKILINVFPAAIIKNGNTFWKHFHFETLLNCGDTSKNS
jgi:hypothetical protein